MKMNKNAANDGVMITYPLIDKLSGVVDLEDAKLNGVSFGNIIDWLNTNEVGVIKVPVAGKYQLAVKIHYPLEKGAIHKGCPALLLQITNPKVSKRQLRFEYNPFHMTEAGMEHLDTMMTELVGMEFYQLLYHARFTRADFCRLIISTDIEDCLFYGKWKKVSQCFFGADGKLETVNLGKSGSNQIIAYNAVGPVINGKATGTMIRVETRCRINLKIQGLKEFKNPFENVKLFRIGCDNPPLGVAHWKAFQDSCRLRGVGNAIKNQPAQYRSALKKALSLKPVSEWPIENWPEALEYALGSSGLMNIPSAAPPLDLAFLTGEAV